MNVAVNVSHKI